MDASDGGGGGDAFAGKLMSKARAIQQLAERKHNEELYYAGMGGGTEGAKEAIKKKYAWIPQWLEAYTTLPDPRGFESLIDAMDPVLKILGQPRAENNVLRPVETAMGGIENARLNLAQWQGSAKDAFMEFSAGWDTMAGNQGMVAYVLKHAMLANQEIFSAARKDLLGIADDTITALEALTPCGGESDVKTVLNVVTAVAGVASAAATGGGAVALAVVSAAAGLGSSAGDGEDKGKRLPIGSHYVDGVLENMTTATSQVSSLISDKEQEIVRALKKDITIVTELNPGLYVAPRPSLLADMPASKARDRLRPD